MLARFGVRCSVFGVQRSGRGAPRHLGFGLAALLALYCAATAFASSPTVMLLIEEKNLGTIPTDEVQALAARRLLSEGLTVVDQDMVRANIKKDQQLLRMAGDNKGAAALGTKFGADIVIVGDAVAKPSARRIAESNLRTYQAVVTLRAIQTDTSATLATASESASVIGLEDVSGGSKSLKAAGKKTLDLLVPEFMESWQAQAGDTTSPGRVELSFGGVDQLWKLKAIRKALKSRSDLVRGMTQRSYTSGAAVFEVDSQVPVAQLSEELVLDPPPGLKLQVLDVSASKIGLRAVAQ